MEKERIYRTIRKNKLQFETILKIINMKFLPFSLRLLLANKALKIATYNQTGYFYSNKLENFYTEIAQKYNIKNENIYYKPNSVLHVMTTAYNSGGHTRVVERWIENTEHIYKNTIVLLNQRKEKIPKKLFNYVIKIDGYSKIKKALDLRKLALEYEFIVLHIHPSDPIATIAFGTENFTRPVLFFNHADHMFWIGKTISDKVLDIRTLSSISKKYRNINDAVLCPIPCDFSNSEFIPKKDAREILGIDENEKVIVTSGSSFKYNPIEKNGIFKSFDKILAKNNIVKLIVIGSNGKNWDMLKCQYGERVKILPTLTYKNYSQYISSADLIIDSYPFGGGTSLCDAMKAKIPIISLRPIDGSLDFIEKSMGICFDKNEFIEKVLKAINNNYFAQNVLQDELKYFEKECSIEHWLKNIIEIYNNIPKTHKLRAIPKEKAPCFINDYSAMLYCMYKTR